MTDVYALLVGIDVYQDLDPLTGCRNDVKRVEEFLKSRTGPGERTVIETLEDGQATRNALITTFRAHLGQAGPGDRALFWFSGHGSQVPVTEDLWHLEPSGESQTLVCADSRAEGGADLLDRELGVLITEVADRGAHVTVVLDCCHSAGGTREAPRHDPDPVTAELTSLGAPLAVRWVGPGHPHDPGMLLPELTRGGGRGVTPGRRADHVALAACRNHQRAYEIGSGTRRHGSFTAGLLDALGRLGPRATYRNLMVAARCFVENLIRDQVPQLYPPDPDMVDRPFLGGALHQPESPVVLRQVRGEWQIDVGRLHGVPTGAGEVRVALPGAAPLSEARVTEVLTERSLVEPIGWQPDPARQYPVVFSRVPLPETAVVVGGRPGDDPATAARITGALRVAGPNGTPSPYVQVAAVGAEVAFRVSTADGEIRVSGFDGAELTGDLTPYDIGGVVSRLEHLARWRTVKMLTATSSRLAGAVRLDVVRAGGLLTAPREGGGIVGPGPDGVVVVDYERDGDRWVPPLVFLRLHNLSDRRLYCAILDLSDRYAVHPDLFPGDYVGAGRTAAAFDGDPVEFTLPGDLPVRPGAAARDWIQVVAAEEEFNAGGFRLDPLGSPPDGDQERSGGLGGVLDLIGAESLHRVAGRRLRHAYDWTTVQVPVVTRVPGG